MMIENYICSIILLTLGLYVVMVKKNLVQIVVGLGLLDYGVNLLIVSIGYNEGGTAPLYIGSEITSGMYFVDPVPQALTLTSIVIGARVTNMALSIVVRIGQTYVTLDADKIMRLRG